MVSPRRILVVDDEPVVSESCRRVLGRRGYEVATVTRGRDGLDRAMGQHFDLVITDLRMPDLDGMDLVRAIRRERPNTSVMIITGYGTVGSAVEALRLGVEDYIEKPFTPAELTSAVDHALVAPDEPTGAEPARVVEADLVKEVLRQVSAEPDFGRRLLESGGRVLSGLALSREAKAAIASGDIVWVEKRCGELTAEERDWLERRLQAEIW